MVGDQEFGEPNIETDDLSYRRFTQAEAANVLPPPPPFGIPLTPVVHSAGSDYARVELDPRDKKKVCYTIRVSTMPHLIRDDMAFRNLRRDLSADRKSPPLLPVTTQNPLYTRKRKPLSSPLFNTAV